jgi:hypothetical protein
MRSSKTREKTHIDTFPLLSANARARAHTQVRSIRSRVYKCLCVYVRGVNSRGVFQAQGTREHTHGHFTDHSQHERQPLQPSTLPHIKPASLSEAVEAQR